MQNVIEDFLTYLSVEKGFSANTLAAYRNDLTQFEDFLKTAWQLPGWASVEQSHIVGFILLLKERSYASSTVARKTAAVKSFFHFLSAEGLRTEDPTQNLDSPKVSRYLPKAVSLDQVDDLLEQPSHSSSPESARDRAMLAMLCSTGMRVSELVALDLGDVDLGTRSVRCRGKGSRERMLPLTEISHAALSGYLPRRRSAAGQSESENALFLNHRGHRLTRQGFWLILKAYAEEAGLADVTPRTLRHSFATNKIHAGSDLMAVQKLLGHASIATTQVYARLAADKTEKREPTGVGSN